MAADSCLNAMGVRRVWRWLLLCALLLIFQPHQAHSKQLEGEGGGSGSKTPSDTKNAEEIFSSLYHTQSALLSEYKALASQCPGVTVTDPQGDNVVTQVRMDGAGGSGGVGGGGMKILVFFNEHANEVITAEVGLGLAKRVCKSFGMSGGNMSGMSGRNMSLLIVPIVDVTGRQTLEDTPNFCQRKNAHHVDLNRNWDARWTPGQPTSQDYGGPQPFSEVESIQLKKVAKSFAPDAFIDVHSGTLGFYTPYSYSTDLPHDKATENSNKIFKKLNAKYCGDCPAGGAGEVSGYLAYGTAQDYVYDSLKVPYSVVVEVYGPGYKNDGRGLKYHRFRNKTGTLRDSHKAGMSREAVQLTRLMQETKDTKNKDTKNKDTTDQTSTKKPRFRSSDNQRVMMADTNVAENPADVSAAQQYSCLSSANPVTKEELALTIDNWSSALYDMIGMMVEAHSH